MSSICFYFQVHQPYRIRRYRYSQIEFDHQYFDDKRNPEIFKKVANKCYLPANKKILSLIKKWQGKFKVTYSISGLAFEQMKKYTPEVLKSFQELRKTECVEFLAETYYHSLASIYDPMEFREQVLQHCKLMEKSLDYRPRVFRNTELIYSDEIGRMVDDMGFMGCLAEGADDVLEWRSPNFVYGHPDRPLKLMLKNYRLSDDIAFRFSNREWPEFPLTAPKFANWIHTFTGCGDVVNLFMDYETFGEHQWESTGIFSFLEHLPAEVFKKPEWNFCTPSEAMENYPTIAPLSFRRLVSWADQSRDLSAWQGNEMQHKALGTVYHLKQAILKRNNPAVTDVWRKLQASDHFYYMCTKWFSDGDVHAYFSPFKSPYEAFLSYMNVLTDVDRSILQKG